MGVAAWHLNRTLVVFRYCAIVVSLGDEVANQKGARVVRAVVEHENPLDAPDRFVVTPREVEEIAGSSLRREPERFELLRPVDGRHSALGVALHRVQQGEPVMRYCQRGIELERALVLSGGAVPIALVYPLDLPQCRMRRRDIRID